MCVNIEVGYGLEHRLTDAQSKLIIANEITPGFKQGRFYLGIKKGINGIIQATRGAYKGTGLPKSKKPSGSSFNEMLPFIFFVIF
ncbi:MAG: TPM domain-containing protein [bacterium]|nr:TPM domain-containing protein [bacterium]